MLNHSLRGDYRTREARDRNESSVLPRIAIFPFNFSEKLTDFLGIWGNPARHSGRAVRAWSTEFFWEKPAGFIEFLSNVGNTWFS